MEEHNILFNVRMGDLESPDMSPEGDASPEGDNEIRLLELDLAVERAQQRSDRRKAI